MSIALAQKVRGLELRVEQLETALQALLRAEHTPRGDVEAMLEGAGIITKIKNEIQGIKMRMGKQ